MFKWILSKDGKYLFAKHNSSIRADLNGDVYGGGGDDEPEMPKPKTPEQMMGEYSTWASGAFPEYYGTREWGAKGIKEIPEYTIAPIEYEEFGPTSFEEALGARHFETVWPETERTIKHALSLSGMAYSPILAETLGRERGKIGYDIGRYLTELGEQRAIKDYERRVKEIGLGEEARRFALSQALATQPMEYLPTWQEQEQQRYQASLAEYQRALKEYEAGKMGGTWGALGGAGLGALIAAPFTGGLSLAMLPAVSIGAGLGGMIGEAGWGGEPPITLGQSLGLASLAGGIAGLGGAEGALTGDIAEIIPEGGLSPAAAYEPISIFDVIGGR